MSYFPDSLNDSLDFLITCYMYGWLAYFFLLFLAQTHSTLLSCHCSESLTQPDFYTEVKELLDPTEELVLESNQTPYFASLTIRELRTYIKDNQLHYKVRGRLGKSVSNARKSELVACLNSL